MGRISRYYPQVGIFCHNINDDINTDEIILPWADTTESSTFAGRQGMLVPVNMRFVKFVLRYTEIVTSHTLTFTIYETHEGTEAIVGYMGNASFAVVAGTDDHTAFTINAADMSQASIIPDIGRTLRLTIQADADPAASVTWYASSVWEFDNFRRGEI